MPRIFSIGDYVKFCINYQKIKLEIRCIKDRLFVEKIWMMQINANTATEIFDEILSNNEFEILKVMSVEMTGTQLKPESQFHYDTNIHCLIYGVYTDKNDFIIQPGSLPYKILNPGDSYSVK